MNYADFLQRKSQIGRNAGFEPLWLPDCLKQFQKFATSWSIEKGRSAMLQDCGLGKTVQQLVWSDNCVRHSEKPGLVLTPLAVAGQTVREASKFGIPGCVRSQDGKFASDARVVVANYDRLHYFKPDDFSNVVCDEASCIKAMEGRLRGEVTEFLRTIPYRLLCTATAAPNDYVELGTLSEALGEMGQRDMITKFFKQYNDKTETDHYGWGRQKYFLKGHSEIPFWRWVCSWARACRKPSDLGFSDDGFELPPLIERQHVVKARTLREGYLFDMPAVNMREEREERRRTLVERCEKAAELVTGTGKPAVIWCHLNPEGNLLAKLVKDGRQVKGSMTTDEKEESYEAFAKGDLRVLIIKPKIGAWGLNWQHCNHAVTFTGHSYEQYYQLVRRCWRYGQLNKVEVDMVATEGEQRVSANLARKAAAADRMFTMLVGQMNRAMGIDHRTEYKQKEMVPAWL